MAIPASGLLTLNDIQTEFGGSNPISLSEYYRSGGLVPNTPTNSAIPTSGTIAIGNFYGSSAASGLNLTISANTQNYDVYTAAIGAGYSSGDVTVTINPGIVVGSNSTGAYALLVPSAFSPSASISITNSGTIIGSGGAGGTGGNGNPGTIAPGTPGLVGGNAIYVNRPTTVTNNGTIAGGGGGGGGGGAIGTPSFSIPSRRSGGGGGGGAGDTAGAGGAAGGAVPAGAATPGNPGTLTAGGAGGAGTLNALPGGPGGGQGASGTSGVNGPVRPGGSGGGAGNYIVGNPFVTWSVTGTRLGGVA
jgi:hypothetical protein